MPSHPLRPVGHSNVLKSLDEIVASNEAALVAVDAPLVIPNQRGPRICDALIDDEYEAKHAGCYPMNLGSQFAANLLSFSDKLVERGFKHGCNTPARQVGRQLIEVYPHPAVVELFALTSILRYKEKAGRTPEFRVSELSKLCSLLLGLGDFEPALKLHARDLPKIPSGAWLTNRNLKLVEDMLDGIVCAYVAAHWWFWGSERNTVFGSELDGYIIVPLGRN